MSVTGLTEFCKHGMMGPGCMSCEIEKMWGLIAKANAERDAAIARADHYEQENMQLHANHMDHPGGPRCACGLPSAKQDGSCLRCYARDELADRLDDALARAERAELYAECENANRNLNNYVQALESIVNAVRAADADEVPVVVLALLKAFDSRDTSEP